MEQDGAAPSEPWLHDCVISLSPCSDLLVVAREQKAIFLSGQLLLSDWLSLSSRCFLKVFLSVSLQPSGVQMTVVERR